MQVVHELQQTKANKIDTQMALNWVEVLNRQVRQVVVLMTEILRFEVQKDDIKDYHGKQHV